MKLVLLIDSLAYGGGAERQFVGLASDLHQRGYDVKVVAYYNHKGYQSELSKEGIKFTIIQDCLGPIDKIKKIRKEISKESPSVVISYKDGPNKIACILKVLGAKWKLIVSDRNTIQKLSRSLLFQYKVLYRFANAIVPNSYSQKNYIESNFPFLKKKITVITNFTDVSLFCPNNEEKEQHSPKTLIVVARIAKQKNVKRFIEAARILSLKWKDKLKIEWYGKVNVNEQTYGDECRELVKKYSLEKFFYFKDTVKDIHSIYKDNSYFCLPSLWEGFPNALCEAMASGLVVVASNICDNATIIDNGNNGLLFNPLEITEMAKMIDIALSFPEKEKKRMSQLARQYAILNLSISTFTDKYINLINDIMNL